MRSTTPELMPLRSRWPTAVAEADRSPQERHAALLRPDGKTQVTIAYETTFRCAWTPWSSPPSTRPTSTWRRRWIRHPEARARDRAQGTGTRNAGLVVDAGAGQPHGKVRPRWSDGRRGPDGRKIIVDTYGGWARHGGGAFSGKDPSKVDRSAAYAMRWVAKTSSPPGWRSGLRSRSPMRSARRPRRAIYRDLRHRDGRPGQDREDRARGVRPAAARSSATWTWCARSTRRPRLRHFGRTDIELPWEQLNKVDDLKRAI